MLMPGCLRHITRSGWWRDIVLREGGLWRGFVLGSVGVGARVGCFTGVLRWITIGF